MATQLQVRRILCPTDFSAFARRAFAQAVVFARRFDASVTVPHVIPYVLPWDGEVPYFPAPLTADPVLRVRTTEELESFVAPMRQGGVPIDVRLLEGDPWREIAGLVESIPADLLVLGTHGRGGFDRFILGSVTEKLLRHVLCPVLTVGHTAERPATSYRRILCATDLWDSSAPVLDAAIALAQKDGAELRLLHVLEGVPEFDLATGMPYTMPVRAANPDIEGEARARLHQAAQAASGIVTVESVGYGRAYKEILRVATETKVDLIVMGAHGHGVLDRLFFGSTSQHVVRAAACPVLTIRSRKAATHTSTAEAVGAASERESVQKGEHK